MATDASEYCFGVCLKECKKDVCEIIGRTSERARFRKRHPDTPAARTTFFDQHRFGFDSRGDLIDLIENDDAAFQMMLVPFDGFPEVPLEVASGRWRYRNESSLSWRAELSHAGVGILVIPNKCIKKKSAGRLWTIWPQPSSWKDGDHALLGADMYS